MTYTTAGVNTWFQTIDGLPPTTASIASSTATEYVDELNAATATPGQIQANLENFPFNPTPPPTNTPEYLFYRTSVAQFVLREFQAAWDVVPSTGPGSQYDNWVARIIANPSLENGGMSQALAGTPQFMSLYSTTSASEPASLAFVTQLAANLGVAVGPGALLNVGLPVWQVLQNFVESPTVIASLETPIANFQNLLLAGVVPGGSIFDLPPPTPSFTLTIGVDTPTTGFTTGHGAIATAAGSVFNAPPASNPPLGVTNTLNAGDDLEATGAAFGATTLNYTAVNSLAFLTNGPNPTAVTMNGVSTANITSATTFATAGFSGNITGLTTVVATTAVAGNTIELGTDGIGLNTALTDITLNSSQTFEAWMTAAAFGAGTDTATVHLTGVTAEVDLNPTTGATGYGSLTVDSGGTGGNTLTLDTTATTTATITATGADALDISGTALNIANLHKFDGSAATGDLTVWFFGRGTGAISAAGGSGDNDLIFGTVNGTANFTAADSVNGGTGTNNTLSIEVESGAILLAGVGSNITNIHTIEQISNDVDGNVTGATSADMSLAGSATVLALDANYVHNNVTVTNLTNADTVTYGGQGPDGVSTGSELGTLTLSHAAPIGLLSTINFTLDATTSPAELTVDSLVVAATSPINATLNIDSTGDAGDNDIIDVSGVAANVVITGGTHLTFGSAGVGDQYSFLHGVIDASGDTGGVTTWLNRGEISPVTNPTPLTTFIAGTGTNIVNLLPGAFAGNLIDFSKGGTDTVSFTEARYAGDGLLTNNPPASTELYNSVLGFDANPNNLINIHNSGSLTFGGAVFNTDGTGPVAAGAAIEALDYTTGTLVNASTVPNNFIDITTAVNTVPGVTTASSGFALAMGAGFIHVAAAHPYLMSYYDVQDQEAVLGSVTSGAAFITALNAPSVNVIGLIHMSEANYATFASHLAFA